MKLVTIAVVLLAGCWKSFAADRVTVQLLGLFHPNELVVSAGADHPLVALTPHHQIAVGDSLCQNAVLSRAGNQVSFHCGEYRITEPQISFVTKGVDAPFLLAVPGILRRRYCGRLKITAGKSELIAIVDMDMETAVASIVAAELPSDTPFEALRAQAVVTRSFLNAGGRRHAEAEFCDTTHCQFLRSPPPSASPAARATDVTRGLLLTWLGKPFPAMYSASCGGTTRSLAQSGYRPRDYPYFAVECPYCRRHPQQGTSPGHGIGLCQKGAAAMAQEGTDFRGILSHYFPNTEIRAVDSGAHSSPDSF